MRRDAARWRAAVAVCTLAAAFLAAAPRRPSSSAATRRRSDSKPTRRAGRWSRSARRGSRSSSSRGGPSTRAPPSPRSPRSRSSSGSGGAIGPNTCRPYRGRRSPGSSPRAPPRTARTGPPVVAADAAELRRRRRPATARPGSSASRTGRGRCRVLEIWTDWSYRRFHHLYGRLDLPRRGRLRLPLDPVRRSARHLRAQRLRRHLRLRVRHRLEAREQLPHPRAGGGFCYGFYPHGPHGVGQRQAIPRHRDRPGRDTRCDVAGTGPGDLRRRA